jgi:hypothetical protein
MKFIKNLAVLLLLVTPFFSNAQDVEMADALRSNGKIYVVVIIIAVILAGLFIFLMSIDQRLRKLERKSGK